jgi:hypothetical protein
MNRRLLGVVAAGLALAVAAESATYLPEEPGLAAADTTVGLAFIGLGVVAWQQRTWMARSIRSPARTRRRSCWRLRSSPRR